MDADRERWPDTPASKEKTKPRQRPLQPSAQVNQAQIQIRTAVSGPDLLMETRTTSRHRSGPGDRSVAPSSTSYFPPVGSYPGSLYALSTVPLPVVLCRSRSSLFLEDFERKILSRMNFEIADTRATIPVSNRNKPIMSTMCILLVDPSSHDIHASHELLPADFGCDKILAAAAENVNFNAASTIFYTTLTKNGRVIRSGTIGLRRELGLAVKIVLVLIGRSRDPLRDGNPRRDEYDTSRKGELLDATAVKPEEPTTTAPELPTQPREADGERAASSAARPITISDDDTNNDSSDDGSSGDDNSDDEDKVRKGAEDKAKDDETDEKTPKTRALKARQGRPPRPALPA
ncbi:hypothetical protein CMUS01_16060 [Colletotrichum musicola]|uniref:Uncharacterized protein n=1 Tax=Colletotrichum musicola TaxID=2175873 RepID=A0A8H6IRT7_9PEZI|nr:hypothetical protein CMUS01_16060 [Colletotrichum musicola]